MSHIASGVLIFTEHLRNASYLPGRHPDVYLDLMKRSRAPDHLLTSCPPRTASLRHTTSPATRPLPSPLPHGQSCPLDATKMTQLSNAQRGSPRFTHFQRPEQRALSGTIDRLRMEGQGQESDVSKHRCYVLEQRRRGWGGREHTRMFESDVPASGWRGWERRETALGVSSFRLSAGSSRSLWTRVPN